MLLPRSTLEPMPTLRQQLVSEAAHLYPLYSGCGRFANSRIVRALAGSGSGHVWARHRNGMRVRVSLDDFNGRAVFYSGDVDRKITWLCTRIVRPGDTVIDVGANIGLVTLTLAGLVGEKGKVWAFDPNPGLVELIRQSLAENGLENVFVEQCAAGAERGELTLRVPEGHSGRGSLVRAQRGRPSEEITVPVRLLSELIPPNVMSIRLLKIDVEGFEEQVLLGAEGLFDRSPPDAVLFELNDRKGEVRDEPSVRLLREFGYEFMAIPKTLFRMRVRRYDPDRDPFPGHDLLACRQGGVADEIAMRVRAG